MLPRPKPVGPVPYALVFAGALAATQSLAAPVPFVHEAVTRDVRAPLVPDARTLPLVAGGTSEGTAASPAPSAVDGIWQEFNLLQVSSPLAVYDEAHDRLLSVGGSARLENWALSLAGPRAWQPLPASSEPLTFWKILASTLDPSTGLVYYIDDLSSRLEIHSLDPLTGTVAVIPGSKLPPGFAPILPAMVFDPVNHRVVVFGTNSSSFAEAQVWALDLMPTPVWSQWLPTGTPPPPVLGTFITPTPAVLDPIRRRIIYPVVLPADEGNGPLSIWTLTLDGPPQWLHFESNRLPDGTVFSQNPLVCDAPGDRLVTLGGEGDLFALSLETFHWSSTPARNPGPAPRVGAGITIDLARRRLLVCGGMPPSFIGDTYGDAWALSLDHAPVWSKLVPDAMRAPIRGGASDGYDASRRRLVVFGGSDERGGFRNDTWVVDLRKDPAWAPLSTRGETPPPRYWHASAWDPRRDQLVVYGGFNGDPDKSLADLWTLSFGHGSPTWTRIEPAGPAPPGRMLSQLVYDSARDRFLLLHGSDELNFLDDVWELRLSPSPAWRRLALVGAAPTARAAQMCVYDPGSDRVLLFGGVNNSGGPLSGLLNDLWALELGSGDGQWQELSIAPTPSVRSLGLLRLDTNHGRLLLFGGFGLNSQSTSIDLLNDTWELDLAGTPAWRQLSPAGFPPMGRDRANGTYDAAHDRLVLACGNSSNDLWTLAFRNAPGAALPLEGAGRQGPSASRVQILAPALEMSAKAPGGRVSFAVHLPTGDPATLALFDLAGRSVWSTPVGHLGAGSHDVEMSGPSLPPAVYFARLTQGRAMRCVRIALVR